MREKYYLSVDSGGTKTDVVLADRYGNIVSRFIDKGSNYQSCGEKQSYEVFKRIYKKIYQKIRDFDMLTCVFGVAGFDTKYDEIVIRKILEKSGFKKYELFNDAYLALKAGIEGNKYGIVIVSGTGNILYGVGQKGIMRLGGYGGILGDVYNGPSIGYTVLNQVFKLWMLGKEKDAKIFIKELLKFYKQKNMSTLLDYITANFSKVNQNIGYLLKPVISAYKKGDKIIKKLIYDIVEDYSQRIVRISYLLKINEEPIKVILSGGVFFNSRGVLDKLLQKKLGNNYKCEVLKFAPVMGGLIIGYEKDKILSKVQISRLENSLRIQN